MTPKANIKITEFSFAAFILGVAVLLFSCNQKKEKQPSVEEQVEAYAAQMVTYPKDSFEEGKILGSIPLVNNNSESFALYLPKMYDTAKKYPVMLFLDIYGQGTVPLEMYSSQADKHSVILVGSNNFSKKFNTAQSTDVAGRLVKEITERFNVDEKQVTLCGYGNGAKGSIETACNNPKVTRVVYIGAAADLAPVNHPVDMLGFAGTKDLNYSNIVLFSAQAMPANLHTQLLEWPGKQEWVPAAYFEPAFTYPFSAIPKDKLVVVDEKKKGDLKFESAIRKELKESMNTRDLNWWRTQVADMNKKKKDNPMMDRLLGYVALGCYSLSNSAIQQKNMPLLDKIIPLYELVEPGNEDLKKFKAAYLKMKSA